MDGDRVLVSDAGYNRFGKKEARIVEITERVATEVVGRYRREAGISFVEPENRRITKEVLVEDKNGLQPNPGDHVRATITQYPSRDHHVLVRLEEIIATPDQAGMEIEVALRRFEIPTSGRREWKPRPSGSATASPTRPRPTGSISVICHWSPLMTRPPGILTMRSMWSAAPGAVGV